MAAVYEICAAPDKRPDLRLYSLVMKNVPSGSGDAVAPFEIVYRDSALIVVNKPAGVLVIPSPKGELDTLGVVLNEWLTKNGSTVGAFPCHRIDRETSGLMVYAFGKSFRQKVMDSFEKRTVNKTYLALANGLIGADQGEHAESDRRSGSRQRLEGAWAREGIFGGNDSATNGSHQPDSNTFRESRAPAFGRYQIRRTKRLFA